MPSELFIDASDPSLQGLYRRANGTLSALTPAIVRNDVLPRRIHVMEESVATAIERLRHRVIAGASLKVAIGYPDLGPSAGTFPLSSSGDSGGLTLLAYNITAANLEIALNNNPAIAIEGGVDVTGTAPQYIVTWRTVGAKALLASGSNALEPSSVVSIQRTQTGDATFHEEQVIRLLRRPYAYSSNWSVVSDPSTATATQVVVGSASTKGVVDVTFPETAESGSGRLEFTRAQVWRITAKKNTNAVAQRMYLEVGTPDAAADYAGLFFDIEDKDGPVRVWLDFNNTSTPPAVPAGGRLLEVDYNSAVASVILAAIKAKLVADAEFSGTQSFELTKILIVQTTAGERVAPPATVVGASAGATITMSVERAGANGDLAATYFDIADNAGTVAVWLDVHNDVEPNHGANRSIRVDASGFTSATAAATAIAAALDADTEFAATASTSYVTVTDAVVGTRTPGAVQTGALVSVVTAGAGISGEFAHDVEAAELADHFGDFWAVTATKPRQFRFVSKAAGAWAAPSIASNFVVPTYFDGTITLATTTLMAAFAATTDETLEAFLEVEYTTPAGAVETILRMPVQIHRDVLDAATIGPGEFAETLFERIDQLEEASRFPLSVWSAMPVATAKLTATGAQHLNVLLIGDSLTSDAEQIYRDTIKKRFGFAGWGMYGALGVEAYAGGAAAVNNAFTLWINGTYHNLPAGGSAIFKFNTDTPVVADTIKVAFIKESGGGEFKIQLATDGSTFADDVTGISASNGTTIGAVHSVATKATPNTYSVKLVNTHGSAAVKIIGVELSDSTKRGAVITSILGAGIGIDSFVLCPTAISNPILAGMAPDLVIFKKADPAALLTSHLGTLYSNIRAGDATNDWIFNLTHQMNGSDNLDRVAVLRAFAITQTQSAHDDHTWSGTYAYANSVGWMTDGTHRNATGNTIGVSQMFDESPLNATYVRENAIIQAFRLTRAGAAAQAIVATVWTDVVWTTEVLDQGPIAATPNVIFTETGLAHLSAMAYFDNTTAGEFVEVRILKDGAQIAYAISTGAAGDYISVVIPAFCALNTGNNVYKLQVKRAVGTTIGGETYFDGWLQK